MRDYILLYINAKEYRVKIENATLNLSSFLRDKLNMKGTKIVCSEGDCGACTVLCYSFKNKKKGFISINSCITPLYLLDSCHIVTIEAIKDKNSYHQVQEAFAKYHGTQCGFCTPGFINSFIFMCDDLKNKKQKIDIGKIKDYTTGNLCRCTGYKGILEAGMSLDLDKMDSTFSRYHTEKIDTILKSNNQEEVHLKDDEKEIYLVNSIKKASELKSKGYKVISGGTDISVFINKGFDKTNKFVSLINIEKLHEIKDKKEYLKIGAMLSLSSLEKSVEKIFPVLAKALEVFASPQIKNRATLVGNIANGSPIGDTIPFLFVSDASLVLSSKDTQREVLVKDFYLGYKQFDLKDDEIISFVKIPKTKKVYKFYKVSARKDLDISCVSLAISYILEEDIFKDISIAYGGVAATVYKAKDIEALLLNKECTKENFYEASKIVPSLLSPFSDHRGSSEYRIKLCKNLLMKFYNEIKSEVA